MELSRLFLVFSVLLLSLCLIFSVFGTVTLRRSLSEAEAACLAAEELLRNCDAHGKSETATPTGGTDTGEDIAVDILYGNFLLLDRNGKIVIYTADGYLIGQPNISTDTLPAADREALRVGIRLSSWREVLAVLQDLGA